MYISNNTFNRSQENKVVWNQSSSCNTETNPLYKTFIMYQVSVTVAMQQVSICTYGYNQSSSLVPQL